MGVYVIAVYVVTETVAFTDAGLQDVLLHNFSLVGFFFMLRVRRVAGTIGIKWMEEGK